ncbi:MAG TPA: phosphotransferase [Steroidobacteraceae bacterium]
MRKIGSGHKSDVYELPDGRILKLFVAEFVALAPVEIEMSRLLARAGVPAPRVAETMEVDGRPGIVFGNLRAGETLSSTIRSRPWRILAGARELAALHSAVHACRSAELPSQRERLEAEIRAASGVSGTDRSTALRSLASLPDGNIVCHNDIHMLNVIVHPAGSTLIDWVLATRGNPLADVAAAVLQLRFGEQPRGFVARTALELGRAVFWRVYLRRYLALRPCDTLELARWELPVAVGLAGRREGRMRNQLLDRVARLGAVERGRNAVKPP